MNDELLSAEEIGKRLDLHPKTVCERAAAGLIPGAKIGRAWKFLWTDILESFRSQYKCPSTSPPIPTTGISRSRTKAGELESLLGLPTGKRRRNTTTNTKQNSGEREN